MRLSIQDQSCRTGVSYQSKRLTDYSEKLER